jgi:two-component system OmpR family response regulator
MPGRHELFDPKRAEMPSDLGLRIIAGAVVPVNENVILIAEDDPVVRNLVRAMLAQEGYATLAAKDGEEALKICETFKHPVHLLLTDISMPSMDGYQLAACVRALRPEIKVITMSGETIDSIRAGNIPSCSLHKPFVPQTLLNCVKMVLASTGPVNCDG